MRLMLVAMMLVLMSGEAGAQDRPAQVQVDPVIVEDLAETVPVIGRVVARQQGEIAAKVEGAIAQVVVEVGERVAAGGVLSVIDPVRLELARDVAQSEYDAALAELQSTQSSIDLLSQERDRLGRLKTSAAFSKAAYDDKGKEIVVEQANLEADKARVAMARALLERRATDLEDSWIVAPYPGVVIRRLVSEGAYVRIGDPIVELINDSSLEIEADIPANRIGGLSEDLRVVAEDSQGSRFETIFRVVVPVENALTRTQAVRFRPLSDAGPEVNTVGQSVTLSIPAGNARKVVTVHKDAVTIGQGQRMVFKIVEDKAMPQPVGLGASVGGRFEVVDQSLVEGDLVVIRGNERLRPGQAVAFEAKPVEVPGDEKDDQVESSNKHRIDGTGDEESGSVDAAGRRSTGKTLVPARS